MKLNNTFIFSLACACAVIGLALFTVSCEKDAGDKFDDAVEDVGEAVEDAGDAVKDATN